MNEPEHKFAEAFEMERYRLRLSVPNVAKVLGLSKETIYLWERGTRTPSVPMQLGVFAIMAELTPETAAQKLGSKSAASEPAPSF